MIELQKTKELIPSEGETYDVVVAGGGPAGLGAALGSALAGARTLLLEARSFFGGVAAIAMWMPMNRLLFQDGRRGGVHDLFVDKIHSLGPLASLPGRQDSINGDGLNIHPEYLRLACFELLEEHGCHYRLYSPVTSVTMLGNCLTGVVAASKIGSQTFHAGVTVDATGDGDVAFLAGAEMVQGREEDGRSMPVSLVFGLVNCDVDRFLDYLEANQQDYQAILEKAFEEDYAIAAWYSFDRTTIPGVLNVNNGALRQVGNIDGAHPHDLTVAERAGIQVALDFVRLARAYRVPGLEDCHLMRVGANVGVRDTRRLVGEYILTVEDARNGPDFPDIVARKYGAIDANQLYIGEMHSGFAYPYRSLLPRQIENLLVAGRCASATFLGHAAGKSMGNMMELGQAAGVAAALCSRENVTPRELKIKIIQATLREMGVRI